MYGYAALPWRTRLWHVVVLSCSLVVMLASFSVLETRFLNDAWRKPGARVLAIGTSHMSGLLVAQLDVPAVKIFYPALDITTAAAVADKHESLWPGLETVIVEVDEFSLCSDVLAAHEDLTPLCGKLRISAWELPDRGDTMRRVESLAGLARGRGVAALYHRNRLVFDNVFRLPTAHAETPVREITPATVAVRIGSANARFFGGAAASNVYEHNIPALIRWVEAMRERGVSIVLVTMPTHPLYNAARPELWEKAVHDAVEAVREVVEDVEYWDFRSDSAFTEADFSDCDHLSRDGAARLTRMVRARLRQRES